MHKELSVKSRVRGDFHARFCERVRVKLPRSTRPCTACEGIRMSMDGRRRCLDNVWIERFWRTIKREYVYINPTDNVKELREGIKNYIEYYNTKRHHQGIEHQIPMTKYAKIAA